MVGPFKQNINPGWLRIRQACEYCNVGERTLRTWLKKGLPFSKVHGVVLISVKNLDEFLQHYEVQESKIDKIVKEILGEI